MHDKSARNPVGLENMLLLMGKGFSAEKWGIGSPQSPYFARVTPPLRRRGPGDEGRTSRAVCRDCAQPCSEIARQLNAPHP